MFKFEVIVMILIIITETYCLYIANLVKFYASFVCVMLRRF